MERRLRAEKRVGGALPSTTVDGRPASRRHMNSQGREYVPGEDEVDYIDESFTPMQQRPSAPHNILVGDMEEFLASDSMDNVPAGWSATPLKKGEKEAGAPEEGANSGPRPMTVQGARPVTQGGRRAYDQQKKGERPASAAEGQQRAKTAPVPTPEECPASIRMLCIHDPYVPRGRSTPQQMEKRWTHDRIRSYKVPGTKPPQIAAPQRMSPRLGDAPMGLTSER